VLVPLRQLGEASTYARSKKKLLDSLRKPASTAAAKTALNGVRVPAGETAPQVTKSPEPTQDELIALAERAVVRIASRTPKNHIARKDIEAQLQQIREFKKSGAKAYLGKKHYQGLMLEVARRNKRIKVKPGKNLSASVMYVPEE